MSESQLRDFAKKRKAKRKGKRGKKRGQTMELIVVTPGKSSEPPGRAGIEPPRGKAKRKVKRTKKGRG